MFVLDHLQYILLRGRMHMEVAGCCRHDVVAHSGTEDFPLQKTQVDMRDIYLCRRSQRLS